MLIEVVVIFLLYVAGVFTPEGFALVGLFFANVDGVADEVGMFFDDLLEFPGVGEVGGVCFEGDVDFGAAVVFGCRHYLKRIIPS